MWTFIHLFISPSVPDTQNDSSNILGPFTWCHICRNHKHGSVGWLRDVWTIVPKSCGLICTSYKLTTQTHMVYFASFALTCFSAAFFFFSFFFCWPLSSSFLFVHKCHTYTQAIHFLVFAVQCSCVATKWECKERLRITGRLGGGQHMEPTAQGHWWPGARGPAGCQSSTCPPMHPVWRLGMNWDQDIETGSTLSSPTNWAPLITGSMTITYA